VLICRCAWHPGYRGYPMLNGIASWRGWSVRFTDGICEKCLARFRAEHHRYLEKRLPAPVVTASPVPTEAR
jgi:Fe-S cluster biosynthesis and repair protein YggX